MIPLIPHVRIEMAITEKKHWSQIQANPSTKKKSQSIRRDDLSFGCLLNLRTGFRVFCVQLSVSKEQVVAENKLITLI